MALPSFSSTVVARAAAALYGLQLGNGTMAQVLAEANMSGGGVESVINSVYNRDFGKMSNADVAKAVVKNLGITTGAADAEAYLVDVLSHTAAGGKGVAVTEAVALFSGLTTHPVYGSAASMFNGRMSAAVAYAQTPGTPDRALGAGATISLGLGQDFLTGTAGDDLITARIINNSNSLQSGDWVDGGAGFDRLEADMGSSQSFAVTPETTGVEAFAVRGQSRAFDSGDNNVVDPQTVKIDAQRMSGVNWYESYQSRADVIVEDVRIQNNQITKDITIAFVESDPGHVDFGVYFDQYSLRNQTNASSSINLRVMDTVAAAAGLAPLKDSNYTGFKFTATINGVARVVDLKSQAIQDAQTYAQLAAAFQAALDAEFGVGAATATVGDNFTVVDPDSRQAVTGQTIVLTTKTAATFTTPAGSGWLAEGTAPPQSNFYTNYTTGATSTATLVTSTIVLDDVGRGSTGGDLVVGGLSTGATSSSLGVQRFEIEVRDNSKLESINSTNNTLREVTIVNGVTTSSSNAYVTTVKDAGKLTVLGSTATNGANLFTAGTGTSTLSFAEALTAGSTGSGVALPGTNASENAYGFTDVRLIDGSAMRGEFQFSAQVTAASIAKYLNLRDIQALPAGDNVSFEYSGGTVNDALYVRIDNTAVGSRNTIVAGREDFTFTANGGAGDDLINVAITTTGNNLIGGLQAWYTNQKLNQNVTLNGGDGNDTIRKPGAGDFKINGGTGNDTIYADNSGVQTGTQGTANAAGAAYQAAEAAEVTSALSVSTLQNNTDAAKTAGVAAALNTLNLLTPISFTDPAVPANPNPALPTKAQLQTGIDNAVAAQALTLAQAIALAAAYNTSTGGTITTPTTLVQPAITGAAPVAGALTAAEFAAGNALLETYIAAAKAAAAEAAAAEANWTQQQTLLNATQLALVNATIAVNGGATGNPGEADVIGTATTLAALTALKSALVVGATDVQVAAAITAAWRAGAFGDPDVVALGAAPQNNIYTAIGGGTGTVDATEVANTALILDLLINNANNANTTATTALATATANNNAAIRAASNIVGADPFVAAASAVANDAVGSNEAEAARVAAVAALTAFNTGTFNPATTVQADLATLKTALATGTTELNANIIITNAAAKGTITGGEAAALLAAANAGAPTVGGVIDATEKAAVDVLITGYQLTNEITVNNLTLQRANLQSVVDATTLAAAAALAAANGSGGTTAGLSSRAVWVFNTANQGATTTTPGTGYVLNVNDERNVFDLKSDVNNNNNFFNTKLTVTFKGLTSTVDVPNTGYRTSDLQINQAIKNAINNDPVLSKLIAAADGPANTLVVTSLIDGVMSIDNLGVVITLPAVNTLNNTEIAAAGAAYGITSPTEALVLAAMATAKTAFDTKGDYIDRLAETGAFGGNAEVTGAASTTTSDNTINPGEGNDVIVLGTTVGLEQILSSNDTVVYQPGFGNDTIVHFKAGALATGGDILNFSALGGTTLSTAFNVNRSINIADEATAINGTAELVAALFADSTTAQTHVYVAVDTVTNVGKVYQVVDAAGTGAGSVTATLAGTIDLSDTLWSTLTSVNFS